MVCRRARWWYVAMLLYLGAAYKGLECFLKIVAFLILGAIWSQNPLPKKCHPFNNFRKAV